MKEDKVKKDDYQKALTSYGEAMKEFRKEKYDKAMDAFKAFIEKYGTEKELVDRAKVYLSICGERTKERKETVSLKTFDDYYQYSVYKMNMGDHEEALKLLDKAQKLDPKAAKVYYLMANLYCQMGQTDTCLENLKKAFHLDKFFKVLVQNETDFESIWEDKKFKLITRMA